ncbi:MAG: Cache 3/Cache 2 fusion domain-containing protein [Caldilineaceae bacterium]|nr:Cache 3/Cache 2 fusion domain-containing protein [Caldilineaceae bacterium]HRJ41912.1 Cache 3/Cache 2 fusion domain-containing protein [Caldilineaceae bacterium]
MKELWQRLNGISVQAKLVSLGIGSILCTAILLASVGFWQTQSFSAAAMAEADALVQEDLSHIAHGVYNLIHAQDEFAQRKVNNDITVARYVLRQHGLPRLGEKMAQWEAVNQFTGESRTLEVPQMLVGDQWLGQFSSWAVEAPVIDEMARLTGQTVAIFQRIDEDGTLLRVATTVQNTNRKRAIGTYIPPVNPDGKPNPVVTALMAGDVYRGVAHAVNAAYVTAYEPIFDENREMIGALYVGVQLDEIRSLRQAIQQTEVGINGAVYVLQGSDKDKGALLIPPRGANVDRDQWNGQDADGRAIYQEIVNVAVQLAPTEQTTVRYRVLDGETGSYHNRADRISYYAPWDWVVVVSAYEEDYAGVFQKLQTGRTFMLWTLGLASLLAALLGGTFTYWLGTSLAKPIREMVVGATSLSMGNIDFAVTYRNRDEMGQLANAFRGMIEYQRAMADAARQIAQGNLSIDIDPKSDEDQLGHSFRQMIENLRNVIGDVQRNAVQVEQSSNSLLGVTQQATVAVSQITSAIDQVANGSRVQAQGMETVQTIVGEQATFVESIAIGATNQMAVVQEVERLLESQLQPALAQADDSAAAGNRSVQQAAQATEKGVDAVTQTIAGMQAIANVTQLMTERVRVMGQRSQEIEGIVRTIDEIADRTNLLALNAAIEAARAGEHGRGFAVVADEVRKLAEQSARSAGEIAEKINGVRGTASQVAQAMDQSNREVESGLSLAEKTQIAFRETRSAMADVGTRMTNLTLAVDAMRTSSVRLAASMQRVAVTAKDNVTTTKELAVKGDSMLSSISNMAAVAEENSAASLQVSFSVDEVSQQIRQSAQAVDALNGVAGGLLQLSQRFVLSAAQTGENPIPEGRSYRKAEGDEERLPVTIGTQWNRAGRHHKLQKALTEL